MTSCVDALVFGFAIGIATAAIVAGFVWLHLTRGDDHVLTYEEIMTRIEEARNHERMSV